MQLYFLILNHQHNIELPHNMPNSKQTHIMFAPTITPATEELFFNTVKAKQILNRMPTTDEITQTLLHIQCWQQIAQNTQIQADEFCLIAQQGIHFTDDHYDKMKPYIQQIIQPNKDIDILLLQRYETASNYWNQPERMYTGSQEFSGIVFHQDFGYNNIGASYYAIRKSKAQQLIKQLTHEKPFWKADYFALFTDYTKIHQINPLVGYLPKTTQQFKTPQQPIFSIIIPIYNTADYIKQAIDSVLVQDYDNYELILVNDGSKDQSLDICLEYTERYPHISLIHKHNSGISDSRNLAIKIAKGDYLLFLDSDDYWRDVHFLSELSQIVKTKSPDFVLTSFSSLYQDNKIISHLLPHPQITGDYAHDIKYLVNELYQGFVSTKVTKRQLIEQHQLYFPIGLKYEDVLWSIQLAAYSQNYIFHKTDQYTYRRERIGSITAVITPSNVMDMIQIHHLSEQFLKNHPIESMIRIPLLKMCHDFGRYIIKCFHILKQNPHYHEVDNFKLETMYQQFELKQQAIAEQLNLNQQWLAKE